jgi:hypothetical protein
MTRLRSALSVLFAALLILTFQQMAAARGMAQAVGEAVLCLGGVQVSVPVDASGNPVEPNHFCPDCIAHVVADSGGHDFGVVAGNIAPAVFEPDAGFLVLASRPQTQRARGPPSLV